MKKNGFTLIELLAVIIILAIVALISTPIVLNVVEEARASANKSSIAMYADAVKLAVIDEYFENQSYPAIDVTWANNNVEYGGERIICEAVYYTENEGVTLNECTIGGQAFNYVDDMSVSADDTVYCYTKGKVYTDCTDEEYQTYYTLAKDGSSSIPSYEVFDNNVNAPQLLDGMQAIKWVDGVETPTTVDDEYWYNYGNKEWANAKTANGAYFVWIPRYAYMIGEGYHSSNANEISIKFLKDDTNTPVDETIILSSGYDADTKNTSDNYFLHPAFENADTKYGFWVAKYEASGTSNDIAIKPGVSSLSGMIIGNMFNAAKGMGTNVAYGWNTSETETHMMTNYEWGAVAYLTQSEYGRCESGTCTEVTVNTNSSYYTGGGSGEAYKTNINQSTTGNITGVYDMSGGEYEYVAAYVDNEHSYLTTYGESIGNSTSKYKNVYIVTSDSRANNYEANKNIYGDAVYEISSSYEGSTSWNGDYSYMPYSSAPWFLRGGYCSDGTYAGVFSLVNDSGNAHSAYGFRPVASRVQS